jgi:hypothetical protein
MRATSRALQKAKKLPPTIKEGRLSMIHKKADPEDIRNYRPITLMNNDYKVYISILLARLASVAGRTVHQNQTHGVPGRDHTACLKLVQTVIDTYKDDFF